ncbi:hypothetical protein BUALT_Bualt01G0014800 [Buddleja alternifolia]|uniref:Uncharacterized protein n=1 Tax=Buddleja alternifolia TaxID=168488 RepID=A0AAV6Y9N2_9LAMI|nr:hypothetical protein BUALT_Bualt01G0014800 [Buddleja alternifolia]
MDKEEDKAFENALALHSNDAAMWYKIALAVPGKTLEDLKLHYEALLDDVAAIESDKVPLPCYPTNVGVRKRKKKNNSSGTCVRRGIPWTDKEHNRFLQGLKKYGRGDWKSISRCCVKTKSNSQVASHAQKYFKRLNSTNKNGKKSNTNDIKNMAPEIPITGSTAMYGKETSTNDWKPPPSPIPFGGPLFASQMITEAGAAPPGTPDCNMFDLPFASELIEEAGPSDIPSTSEMIDVDMFILPHFLDID